MPTLLRAAIDQNFVPVVDDRNVFIGMVRRTVLLKEMYGKYTDAFSGGGKPHMGSSSHHQYAPSSS